MAEVVVVGAGPVGLTAALKMAKAGISVTVFEARNELPDDPRANTLHPPTLELFDQLGVLAAILRKAKMVGSVQYWEKAKNDLVAEFDYRLIEDETSYPMRVHVPQYDVSMALLDELRQQPAARVLFGYRVVSAVDQGTRVSLTVQTHEGIDGYDADFVCGADGSQSAVRQQLEIDFTGFRYREAFLNIQLQIDFEKAFGGLRFRAGSPMGPVAYLLHPTTWAILMQMPTHARILAPLKESEDVHEVMEEQNLEARMHKLMGDRGGFRIVHRGVHTIEARVAETFHRGRIALAGDAAHTVNPAGGMGMNCGIHDAEHLADALIEAFRTGDYETMLAGYSMLRHQVVAKQVQFGSHDAYRILGVKNPQRQIARDAYLRDIAADPYLAREHLLALSMLR